MEHVDHLVVEMIESLPTTPAFVADEKFEVLSSNRLALAISPSFRVGTNLARATFQDPSAHDTLPQWSDAASQLVAILKRTAASAAPAPGLEELLGELSSRSAQFSVAWASESIPIDYEFVLVMDHPQVGLLEITFQHLRLPDSTQTLVLGHVAPGSKSERRLFALAGLIELLDEE
ncbi:hypothetical protein E3O42_11180 [Cryobacterium adonitolivorans]|uniref:MmyB-like transcription regulator ligand binding domain-containing protein n=1 Tax=Cryobacterium adonitolivorans TaxID=1259189 RepID=A0A4R8W772_9MICO|nr:hypothetical protein [Cryobacterium adonitolivorans]TFC01033.1 hypothetical protein E3O42_11180 [Cryobacterium adonitolivorans]